MRYAIYWNTTIPIVAPPVGHHTIPNIVIEHRHFVNISAVGDANLCGIKTVLGVSTNNWLLTKFVFHNGNQWL